MDKNLKLFLFSFLAALPFCWGINVSESKLENLFLQQIVGDRPQIAVASISQIAQKAIPAEVEQTLPDPEMAAKAAISIKFDPQGGEQILFQMNEKEKLPIASLTKLATAMISLDLYPPEQKLKITKEAVRQAGEKGKLKPGEFVSVNELLSMALIESSNDAAYALSQGKFSAQENLLEQEGFTELMNLKMKELELRDTRFFNATGLDNINGINNYSTAGDLAKLAYHISKQYPTILEISNRTEHQALNDSGDPHHLVKNVNRLIGKIPNVIGGKTGYTTKAGGCIILILQNEKSYFVNVILGAESQETRFQEMEKLINWAIHD